MFKFFQCLVGECTVKTHRPVMMNEEKGSEMESIEESFAEELLFVVLPAEFPRGVPHANLLYIH